MPSGGALAVVDPATLAAGAHDRCRHDREFAALELLHALRPSMVVITRMRKDARLFNPPFKEDKPGRPGRKDARQPLLSARVTDPAICWRRVT